VYCLNQNTMMFRVVFRERRKRGDNNVETIDLEKSTQAGPRVAAAETVRSQNDHGGRKIARDQPGIGPHIVGNSDDGRAPREAP